MTVGRVAAAAAAATSPPILPKAVAAPPPPPISAEAAAATRATETAEEAAATVDKGSRSYGISSIGGWIRGSRSSRGIGWSSGDTQGERKFERQREGYFFNILLG